MKCLVCQDQETFNCQDNEIGETEDCPAHITDPVCVVMDVKGPGLQLYVRAGCNEFSEAKFIAESFGIAVSENKNECVTNVNPQSGEEATICICDFDHCNVHVEQYPSDNPNGTVQPVLDNGGIYMAPNFTIEIVMFNIFIIVLFRS